MEKKYIAPEAEIVRFDADNILLEVSQNAVDNNQPGKAPEFDFDEMFGF